MGHQSSICKAEVEYYELARCINEFAFPESNGKNWKAEICAKLISFNLDFATKLLTFNFDQRSAPNSLAFFGMNNHNASKT